MSEKIIIELDKGTVKHRCKDYVIYNVDWLKRHFEQERRFYSENGTLSADAEHIVRLIAKYFESPCTYDYDDVNAYDFCNSADEENVKIGVIVKNNGLAIMIVGIGFFV